MRKISQPILHSLEKVKTFFKTNKLQQKSHQLQFKLMVGQKSKKVQHANKITIPLNKYECFTSYLHQFYNSTSQNGRVNGQQLTFVTGAPGVGKTSLIKDSLRQFRSKKSTKISKAMIQKMEVGTLTTPQSLQNEQRQHLFENQHFLQIVFDFDQNYLISAEGFFHRFHKTIIEKILKFTNDFQSKNDKKLLDQTIILQIILHQNSPEYIFTCLSDTLYSIINDCDLIQLSKQGVQKLQQLNDRYIDTFAQQIFPSNLKNPSSTLYQQIIELIADQLKVGKLQASIMLFLSVFKRVEYENRPSNLYGGSWYESGIQSCGFLMDILNYLCGFGEFNKALVRQAFDADNSASGEKVNRQQSLMEKYKNYYISEGNHIDMVVCFLHLEKLSCFQDPRFVHWLDSLLIRLHNQSNLRTHFPFLIEFQGNETVKHIQKLGRFLVDNPTVLELPGYFMTTRHQNNLPMIFNQQTIRRLFPILGRNPSVWNEAIQNLATGVQIEDIITRRASFMKKQQMKNSFFSRLNRVYLDPNNLPLIDDNTLKFCIRTVLKALLKSKGFLSTLRQYNNLWLFNNPVFTSLFSPLSGILFNHYYYFACQLNDHRYMSFIQEQLENKMSINQKIHYLQWRYMGEGIRYAYTKGYLFYDQSYENEKFKRADYLGRRSDYLLQEYYFGLIYEYKVAKFEMDIKKNYNV